MLAKLVRVLVTRICSCSAGVKMRNIKTKLREILNIIKKIIGYKGYPKNVLAGNIVLHRYKVIYFPIPKCGTNTIKALLAELLYPKIYIWLWKIVFPKNWMYRIPLPYVPRKSLRNYPDYLCFCFVRNPWDRLVSCYNEKFDPKSAGFNSFVKKIGESGKKSISFDEFVYKINDIHPRNMDRHFKPQNNFILNDDGSLKVNLIGKIESFEKDWNTICDKCGLPSPNKIEKHNVKKHKKYLQYYNKKTRTIVAEKYHKDISLFEYSFDKDNL